MPGSIFVCRDPAGSQWQVGQLPPATGAIALIGWSLTPAPVDGGVPDAVARVLARALTSAARVTFPSSKVGAAAPGAWLPHDGDSIRTGSPKGVAARVASRLTGAPRDLTLISTTRAETAIGLFDDGAFPWWLQGQAVLLSAPDAAPPDVDETALVALFEQRWTAAVAALARFGVQGVVRPGVDGDVAALWTAGSAFERIVLGALERETRAAGFDWAVVPEAEFALK